MNNDDLKTVMRRYMAVVVEAQVPGGKPFSPSEATVLSRIINGERAFGGHREIMACHRLAKRGLITVEIRTAEAPRVRTYQFGRLKRYDSVREAGALVDAPKIERAIAKHGTEKLLQAVHQQTAKNELIREAVDWLTVDPAVVAKYARRDVDAVVEAQRKLSALVASDGTIEVWRAMKLYPGAISELGYSAVGRYFTYEKHLAIAYDAGRAGRLYRLHGKLPLASISWIDTIKVFGSAEAEITAHDQKPFVFLELDQIDATGRVLDGNLRPDLGGQPLLTGPHI